MIGFVRDPELNAARLARLAGGEVAPAWISSAGIPDSLDFVRDAATRQSCYPYYIIMASEKTAWQHAKPFVNGGLSGMYVFWHGWLAPWVRLGASRCLSASLLLAHAAVLSSV